MANKSLGRHYYFGDIPGLDYEIDNLYSLLQAAKLKSTDMDLDEVAQAVRVKKPGLLEASPLLVGNAGTQIESITRYVIDVSSTLIPAQEKVDFLPTALQDVVKDDSDVVLASMTRIEGQSATQTLIPIGIITGTAPSNVGVRLWNTSSTDYTTSATAECQLFYVKMQ